jgi:retinol dehydrogenase-12
MHCVQGHDLEMGTNCLGPFVLNWYLQDILRQTAGLTGVVKGSVRVVWLASFIQTGTAKGGILFDAKTDGPKVLEDPMQNYMQSKVGNLFLANEWAEKLGVDGIVSIVSTDEG